MTLRRLSTVLCISLILSAGVLSNPAETGEALPLNHTTDEVFPSAAARITNVCCSSSNGSQIFTFDVEVFEEAWCPIYAIEIERASAASLEPIAWPSGWTGNVISGVTSPGSKVVFTTDSSPLLPGSSLAGFAIRSDCNRVLIRWYPEDADGMLVGKVTLVEFSCPTNSESKTWGFIKAIYGRP